MALELVVWLGRRWLGRPWVLAFWLVLLAAVVIVPRASGLSIRTEPLSGQALASELAFAWGIVGGLLSLGALAELGGRVDQMPTKRRWRIRVIVLLSMVLLPAIPILIFATKFLGGNSDLWPMGTPLAALAHLIAVALAVERIPWPQLRSILFLSLAWWLPAIARGWPFGPARILGSAELPDSARWIAWFGSIIPFILIALALDLVRRPHHEVRHSR